MFPLTCCMHVAWQFTEHNQCAMFSLCENKGLRSYEANTLYQMITAFLQQAAASCGITNRQTLESCTQVLCSVCHSLMGFPCVCRKHTPTPRRFVPTQPGSSHSTPMRVPLNPSFQRREHTQTETLWRQRVDLWGFFSSLIRHGNITPLSVIVSNAWTHRDTWS